MCPSVIELINAQRCTNCNICVRICPTDVFDRTADGPPRIARQEVCQTCFMCEVHCPEDAMYVAPMRTPAEPGSPHLDEQRLLDEGYFGSYRARLGWGAGRKPPRTEDELFELSLLGPGLLTSASDDSDRFRPDEETV
jgi:NAD-dependent dihydropyrimidine dehydrogenase PreA subunit